MSAIHDTDSHAVASPAENALLVQFADELYALPAASVREILRYRAWTPVPGAPPTLPGILSQRGVILPVVEMHALLGLGEVPISRATRLVVVCHAQIDMALRVAGVFDLATLPADTLEAPPAGLDPARARLIRGIACWENRPVVLLDLDEIVAALRA